MKKLLLLILISIFLFSCSDRPPILKDKDVCIPEKIGGVNIGCKYGEQPDFNNLKKLMKNN